jgi:hypothetical protein
MALGFIPPSPSLTLGLRRAVQVKKSPFDSPEPTLSRGPKARSGHFVLILDGLCLHVLSSFQRTDSPPPARLPPTGDIGRRRTHQTYNYQRDVVNPVLRASRSPGPPGAPLPAPWTQAGSAG